MGHITNPQGMSVCKIYTSLKATSKWHNTNGDCINQEYVRQKKVPY